MSTATNGSKDVHLAGIQTLQNKGVTYDELMELYDKCASNDYDQVRVGETVLLSVVSMLNRCLCKIATGVLSRLRLCLTRNH